MPEDHPPTPPASDGVPASGGPSDPADGPVPGQLNSGQPAPNQPDSEPSAANPSDTGQSVTDQSAASQSDINQSESEQAISRSEPVPIKSSAKSNSEPGAKPAAGPSAEPDAKPRATPASSSGSGQTTPRSRPAAKTSSDRSSRPRPRPKAPRAGQRAAQRPVQRSGQSPSSQRAVRPSGQPPGQPSVPASKPALTQTLKRMGSVAKVAGSKVLQETGEGLIGFSQWLEGRIDEVDKTEAAAAQATFEARFAGTWQKWGSLLDQVKAPLPKKAQRISNASITGLLVGIVVFLCLALSSSLASSAASSSAVSATDADVPLTRRSNRSPSGQLVKSRSNAEAEQDASRQKQPVQANQTKEKGESKANSSQGDRPKANLTDKPLSAANFFGEESPRQAPKIDRSVNSRLAAEKTSTDLASPTRPAEMPYPYGSSGYPSYPPPGYGQPATGAEGAAGAAIAPGTTYPPPYPYPYPPYFYPPLPGYPPSAAGADGSTGEQPAPDGQPYGQTLPPSYGGYGYAPYPYPYPPQSNGATASAVQRPADTSSTSEPKSEGARPDASETAVSNGPVSERQLSNGFAAQQNAKK